MLVVDSETELRPLVEDDAKRIHRLRIGFVRFVTLRGTRKFVNALCALAREGKAVGYGVWHNASVVGHIHLEFGSVERVRRMSPKWDEILDGEDVQTGTDAQIHYALDRSHRHKGIMTRSARALIQHAFSDPELAVVRASIPASNAASCAVLERLGFLDKGTRAKDRGRNFLFLRSMWNQGGASSSHPDLRTSGHGSTRKPNKPAGGDA